LLSEGPSILAVKSLEDRLNKIEIAEQISQYLSERLDKLYPDTSSSNDGINYWKGRKIIPLDKWLKITKANTISRRERITI
jgi:hypothetical protein